METPDLAPGPVLCGFADSASGAAGELASAYAERMVRPLVLLHVAAAPDLPDRPFATRSERAERERDLRALEAKHLALALAPAADEHVVELGEPADALCRIATERAASVLVVGRRRHRGLGHAILGGVDVDVARRAPCPVVIVPDRARVALGRDPVVVCGVDASPARLRVATAAAAMSRALGARLRLIHIADGDADHDRCLTPGLTVTVRDVEGAEGPAEALLEHSRRLGAGLVVCGSRGRGSLRTALLGSFSRRLMELAEGPVAVVSPQTMHDHPP